MIKKIIVSVIICSYNRKDDLIKCIESVYSLNYPYLEIIVVDNASNDNSIELVTSKYKNIKIIRNLKNLGASYARNQGTIIAKGEFLWFLDNDSVIINKNCLKNMLKILKQKNIGSVGGEILKEKEIFKFRISSQNGEKRFVVNEYTKKKFKLLEVDYLPTCNCILRKENLIKIGGFDPNYFYLCEDVDIGLKIKSLGLKNIFSGDCAVFHNFSTSGRMSNFYILYRNTLRNLIINVTPLSIFVFPLDHIKYLYKEFKNTKSKENLENIKNIKTNKYSSRFGLIRLSINVLIASVNAYLWNLVYLYQTLHIKKTKPNFLKNVEIEKYIKK